MRSRLTLTLTAAAAALALATPARAQQDTRPGVAVFPFENGGSYGMNREDYTALERGMAGMMISQLAANHGWRVVERENIQKLVDEQNLGGSGRVDAGTAAKIGKIVGAKFSVTGTFVDLSGNFRLDVRLINNETSEIVQVESATGKRDNMMSLLDDVAAKLMQDAKLPPLPKDVATTQKMSRQIPPDALLYYSRAVLYHDQGNKQKAIEMYQRAIDAFPQYAEAQDGLQREKSS